MDRNLTDINFRFSELFFFCRTVRYFPCTKLYKRYYDNYSTSWEAEELGITGDRVVLYRCIDYLSFSLLRAFSPKHTDVCRSMALRGQFGFFKVSLCWMIILRVGIQKFRSCTVEKM